MSTDARDIVKPTSTDFMEDTGSGLDFGVRPDRLAGNITPVDRFFIRSHTSTPQIASATWGLLIEGDGVGRAITYNYRDVWEKFPLVTYVRTIECAGNRRVLFGEETGTRFEGTQWGRGAISTAEWTGVRLRDLLEPAGVLDEAVEVMPESLDDIRARRPLPLDKALADDTIVALAMNGETLPADHGFPARLLVSGWLGAASIKWLGRIEVSTRPLLVPWNTIDYVVIGPDHPAEEPARGPAIHQLPISSLVELPWPAELTSGEQIIRGHAYAGDRRIVRVECRFDDEPWREALLSETSEPGIWVGWQLRWNATPGEHVLRVRATDDTGATQPLATPWNELGYLHESILAHPISVIDAP